MKKALRLCGLLVLLALLLALPASALDAVDEGYTIEQYHVDAVLREDATLDVTETLSVNFRLPSRGIFRAFPSVVRLQKETEGGTKTMRYVPKLRDISASEEFASYSEDGVDYIRLGSESVYLTGAHEYTIHYTYEMGDDRVPEYDELYWSPAGADWNTTIGSLSFSLTLPKAAELGGLEVYSGGYGGTGNEFATVRAEGLTITGDANRTLNPGEAITLRLRLPEGYFSEVEPHSALPAIGMAVAVVLLALIALVRRSSCDKAKLVETVEFYPPEGITSADVGLIVDGIANDKDLLSLIIWFADKGFLSIAGKGDDLSITKLREAARDWNTETRMIWDGLFAGGKETVVLGELKGEFYETLTAAKAALTNRYATKENRLSDTGITVQGILLCIGASVLGLLGYLLCGVEIEPIILFFGLISFFAALVCGILGVATAQARRFWTRGKQRGTRILCFVLYAVILLCGLAISGISLVPGFVPIAISAALVLVSWSVSGMNRLTEKGAELTGKLLGLRSFIEKAELDRLRLLVEENPEYFYSVLPYAYVFGLSDRWADQFEEIAVPPPQWYYGGNGDLFTTIWLSRSLSRSFARVQSNTMSAAMENSMKSGGGGGVSFGGGGFSGGGFGGGGGGRW